MSSCLFNQSCYHNGMTNFIFYVFLYDQRLSITLQGISVMIRVISRVHLALCGVFHHRLALYIVLLRFWFLFGFSANFLLLLHLSLHITCLFPSCLLSYLSIIYRGICSFLSLPSISHSLVWKLNKIMLCNNIMNHSQLKKNRIHNEGKPARRETTGCRKTETIERVKIFT